MAKKLKKYNVVIEGIARDEIEVKAKNKKQAEEKAMEDFYADYDITSVEVYEIEDENEEE